MLPCIRTSRPPPFSRVEINLLDVCSLHCYFFSQTFEKDGAEGVFFFTLQLVSWTDGRRSNGACKSDVYRDARRDVTAGESSCTRCLCPGDLICPNRGFEPGYSCPPSLNVISAMQRARLPSEVTCKTRKNWSRRARPCVNQVLPL